MAASIETLLPRQNVKLHNYDPQGTIMFTELIYLLLLATFHTMEDRRPHLLCCHVHLLAHV